MTQLEKPLGRKEGWQCEKGAGRAEAFESGAVLRSASLRAQGMDLPGTARTPQALLPKPPQQRGLPQGAPAEAPAAMAQYPPQVSATPASSAAAPRSSGGWGCKEF